MAKPHANLLPAADGATVSLAANPLLGAERDEISQLVQRLKQADLRHRTPVLESKLQAPSPTALAWAEAWSLPREVHDFFVLEAAS